MKNIKHLHVEISSEFGVVHNEITPEMTAHFLRSVADSVLEGNAGGEIVLSETKSTVCKWLCITTEEGSIKIGKS